MGGGILFSGREFMGLGRRVRGVSVGVAGPRCGTRGWLGFVALNECMAEIRRSVAASPSVRRRLSLIRPDGYVAWVGEARRTWFGRLRRLRTDAAGFFLRHRMMSAATGDDCTKMTSGLSVEATVNARSGSEFSKCL